MLRRARAIGRWHLSLIRFGSRLATLAPTPLAKAKVIATCAAMSAKERVPWARERWIRLRFVKFGRSFPCVVSDLSELRVLAEVLLDGAYEVELEPDPQLVLDLGSNIGVSVLYFACRYPAARIYGVEPHPATYAKLRENTRGFPNVTVLEMAVGDVDGPVQLFSSEAGSWAASTRATGRDGAGVEVECRRLSGLLDDLGVPSPDLLKIDIEGAEYEVLAGFAELGEVRAVVGEAHPGMYPELDPSEFFALFDGFDVTVQQRPDVTVFQAVNRGSLNGGRASGRRPR